MHTPFPTKFHPFSSPQMSLGLPSAPAVNREYRPYLRGFPAIERSAGKHSTALAYHPVKRQDVIASFSNPAPTKVRMLGQSIPELGQ
jgi:hypothetical protein